MAVVMVMVMATMDMEDTEVMVATTDLMLMARDLPIIPLRKDQTPITLTPGMATTAMAEAGEGTEDTTGLTDTDTATTARDLLLKVPPSPMDSMLMFLGLNFLRLCLTRRGLLPRREVAASMVAWFPAKFENLLNFSAMNA